MKIFLAMSIVAMATAFIASPRAVAQGAGPDARSGPVSDLPVVEVTKRPNCGCCSAWADHLRAEGFEVKVTESDELWNVKRRAGIPQDLDACHTAKVGGYVVEGHVPASDIKRLLAERPAVKGIAVPGMPLGSPGMEGDRTEPYDVLSFDAEGETTVFQSYR